MYMYLSNSSQQCLVVEYVTKGLLLVLSPFENKDNLRNSIANKKLILIDNHQNVCFSIPQLRFHRETYRTENDVSGA